MRANSSGLVDCEVTTIVSISIWTVLCLLTTCNRRFGQLFLLSFAICPGLSKKDQDRVKLHCTVMNASFLVRNMDESSPEYQKLRGATFDASAILKVLERAGGRGCGTLDRVVHGVQRRGFCGVFISEKRGI